MKDYRRVLGLFLLVAALVSSCRSGERDSISVFPTTPGTSWTYKVPGTVEGESALAHRRILKPLESKGISLVGIEYVEGDGMPRVTYYELDADRVLEVAAVTGKDGSNLSWYAHPRETPAKLYVGQEWERQRPAGLAPVKYRVVGKEDVTVTAGVFHTFVVKMDTGDYTDTLYYADGVGLVKQEGMNPRELIEWKPETNT